MLKKINVHDARLGMFIQELCGNWIDHPFWKKAFKLTDPNDLKALHECGIAEVVIDTAKGLDVEQPPPVESKEAAIPAAESMEKPEPHVAFQDEIPYAQKLYAKSKKIVAFIFSEARLGNALQVNEAFSLVDEITQCVSRNSSALLSLARLTNKEDRTYMHSVAVGALMIALGKQMGMKGSTLRSLGMAGLLHNIGKIMIPGDLLNKPGKLTDGEFAIIKTHPQHGWKILKQCHDVDDIMLDVCLHHHERMDGTGYPEKLSGKDISLFSKMAAVCDVYDAMTSDSCYKKAIQPADAIRKMAELQNTHFDQTVFHAFVKTVGIYPTGTLVKLKSGRLAVVAEQTTKSLTTPIVKVFFSTKVNEPIFPEMVDLSKLPDSIANVENPDNWKLDLKAMTGI